MSENTNSVPEVKSENMPESILESIIENVPEVKSETIPEPILETKIPASELVLSPVSNTIIIKLEELETNKLETNNLIDKIGELAKYVKSTNSGKITSLNIILILNNLMQIVEKYNNLTGGQKKMLILDTLKLVINEQYDNSPESLIEKQILFMIIDNTMPYIIDTIVSSINGDIKFAKKNESISSLFKNLFCCKK